jgi:hypothetical protein
MVFTIKRMGKTQGIITRIYPTDDETTTTHAVTIINGIKTALIAFPRKTWERIGHNVTIAPVQAIAKKRTYSNIYGSPDKNRVFATSALSCKHPVI